MTKKTMLKKISIKDWMLYSTALIGYFPSLFHGNKTRVDLFLLVDHTRRIDFYFMYLGHSINYLILLFLLLFPKGLSVRARQFVFLVCILDFFHYVLLSKLYFGFVKIYAAIVIYVVLKQLKKWMVTG
jgi:hypothetical protein